MMKRLVTLAVILVLAFIIFALPKLQLLLETGFDYPSEQLDDQSKSDTDQLPGEATEESTFAPQLETDYTPAIRPLA
jgi:hypothetical protein